MRMIPQKIRIVEVIRRNTLLMFRNLITIMIIMMIKIKIIKLMTYGYKLLMLRSLMIMMRIRGG